MQTTGELFANVPAGWISMGEALLIGLIIGVQRESEPAKRQAGLRDFLLIGLAGGLCGLLNTAWVTAAGLLAITALLAIYRVLTTDRTGITTEMAGVATFLLCVITASPAIPHGAPLAIALTILVAAFLEARDFLRRLSREIITEREFIDTLRFLAVVFVVYPILPDGSYGPYAFFTPKRIWLFVILISSISYVAYFLEKFLGPGKGIRLASVLGAFTSTTATTLSLGKDCAENPANEPIYGNAVVIANTIQFPRVLAILMLVNRELAVVCLPVLAAMIAGGGFWSWASSRRLPPSSPQTGIQVRNPFRLAPALGFAVLIAVIVLAASWAADIGPTAVYWSSVVGGSVDMDAVTLSLAEMDRKQHIPANVVVDALYLAMLANALLKTVLAYTAGGRRFGWHALAGFLWMFVPGAAVVLASGR